MYLSVCSCFIYPSGDQNTTLLAHHMLQRYKKVYKGGALYYRVVLYRAITANNKKKMFKIVSIHQVAYRVDIFVITGRFGGRSTAPSPKPGS